MFWNAVRSHRRSEGFDDSITPEPPFHPERKALTSVYVDQRLGGKVWSLWLSPGEDCKQRRTRRASPCVAIARSELLCVRRGAVAEAQSSRAELLFVEHEPLDFAAAARSALEACGFRILLSDAVARVSGVPAIFAGASSIPASAEPLWRTLIASGNPVLAVVKADDFAHAEWLDKAADVIVWPPASGELAFRVGRWFGAPPGGEN